MLSFISLLRVLATFAPIALVVASPHGKPARELPSLAEATVEELAAGLKAKLFNSVDLVDVGSSNSFLGQV